ncbi:MAG TPA: hypothetical protein VMR66_10390 [Gemmatimonadota bacterium]|nr:hypothetical protein [Gemmatimonadota bacterium]
MPDLLPIVALVVSAGLLAGMIVVLVLLRKGEGPRYSASRAYDANRREAVRVLTGREEDRVTREQWYDRARGQPAPDDPIAAPFRRVVEEALRVVVPPDRDLTVGPDGRADLAAAGARVLAALSTADLRARDLDGEGEGMRLLVGIVLFNPEPPGGDAKRVTLPVQALFAALERAGRADLVDRFRRLRDEAAGEPG